MNTPSPRVALTLALIVLGLLAAGKPITAQAYNVNDPVYPVVYSDADKAAQRAAYLAMQQDESNQVKAGAASYTVPPGVYRVPAGAPLFALNKNGFTLNIAGCQFILENGTTVFSWWNGNGILQSLSVMGDSTTSFDADPLAVSQGTITAYDPTTGAAVIQLMPGYRTDIPASGSCYVYKPDGTPLPVPYYPSYSKAVVQNGIVQATLDTASALVSKGLSADQYKVGNLVAMGIPGSGYFLSLETTNNVSVQNVRIEMPCGFLWGAGSGNWQFINVQGGRCPGTNRLSGVSGCQATVHGTALFDGCEFSTASDDLIDVSGGSLFLLVEQDSPTNIITYGGVADPGDTIRFMSNDGRLLPLATATVAASATIPTTDPQYSTLQSEAASEVSANGSHYYGNDTLRRVTLTAPVSVTGGNFMDNPTNAAIQLNQFTMRNCSLHDGGVRVLVEGFNNALFENNTFTNIHSGLSLTPDTYWWRGVGQNVVVRNNVFNNVTNSTGFPQNQAALTVGGGSGWSGPAQTALTNNVSITGNVFHGSITGGISVTNAGNVNVSGNILDGILGASGYGSSGGNSPIILNSILSGTVTGNSVTGNNSPAILLTNCSGVAVTQNFTDASSILIGSSANMTASANLRSDLFYNLVSGGNGQFADVLNAGLGSGAAIVQNAPGAQADLDWQLVPLAGAAQYQLVNQNSGKSILPFNLSSADGAGLVQGDPAFAPERLWTLLPNADGSSFRVQNALSGKVLALTTMAATSLAPLTQWDDTGTSDHNWRFVPTSGAVPVPGALTTSSTNLAITLNWLPSSTATGYNVYRGTTAGGESSTPIAANGPTATYVDTTAVYGTTYFYAVAAVNGDGTSALSNEASSALKATVSGYEINCGGSATGPFAADSSFSGGNTYSRAVSIDTSGVTNPAPAAVYQTERFGVFSYRLLNLTPGQAYTVRLHFAEIYFTGPNLRQFNVAINGSPVLTNFDIYAAAGAANKAVMQQFATAADASGQIVISFTNGAYNNPKVSGIEIVGIPPATPTGLAAMPASASQINISWMASPAATSYTVYRALSSGGPYTQAGTPTSAASDSDAGLSPATSYFYVVTAANPGGTSGYSGETTATTLPLPPPAPTSLTATANSTSQIGLTWSASTGATSYQVYRAAATGGPYSADGGPTSQTTFTDSGLAPSTAYFYVVTAIGAGGASGNSGQAATATLALPPAAPTGLSATASAGQVTLNWNAVPAAATYSLYRATSAGGEGTSAYMTGLTGTSSVDTSVQVGTTYYYQVAAVNAAGTSGLSAEVSVTPAAALLSQGRTATASSVKSRDKKHFGPALAVDGSTTTGWSSAASDLQWLKVDLGTNHKITDIKLNWAVACGKNYMLQVSSDANKWTTVKTVTNNATAGWLDYPGLAVTGRYVRLYGTARATASGYSVWEFQVYGQ